MENNSKVSTFELLSKIELYVQEHSQNLNQQEFELFMNIPNVRWFQSLSHFPGEIPLFNFRGGSGGQMPPRIQYAELATRQTWAGTPIRSARARHTSLSSPKLPALQANPGKTIGHERLRTQSSRRSA